MWWLIITVLILLLIAAVILFTPICADIHFSTESPGSGIRIEVQLGFKKFVLVPKAGGGVKTENPENDAPDKPREKMPVTKQISAALSFISEYRDEICAVLDYASRNAVYFKKILFHIIYSTADAAQTGILCGVINGAVYGLLGAIHQRAELRSADILIQPDFGEQRLELEAECIVQLKNVHIIVIAVRLLRLYMKIKRKSKGK